MTMSWARGLLVAVAILLLTSCTGYLPEGATAPSQLSRAIIVQKVNQVRAQYGRPALQYDERLAAAAQAQADLMARNDRLSHDLGSSLRDRVEAAGYRGAVGENVAGGQKTLEAALTGWLQSAAHQQSLLNDKFTQFGLGVATVKAGSKSRYGTYWAIVLGGEAKAWLQAGP